MHRFGSNSFRIVQKVMIFVAIPVVINWYHFWMSILISMQPCFHDLVSIFSYDFTVDVSWISREKGMHKSETSERVSAHWGVTLFRARPFF